MEYISMNDTIVTSISVPDETYKKIKEIQKKQFLDTGIYLSLGDIALLYFKKWLENNKLHPGTRKRATCYNHEDIGFRVICVNWSVDDYNILRARVQAIKISLSYVFYKAFQAYGEGLLQEITSDKEISEINLDAFANYYFYQTELTEKQMIVGEKIIYLSSSGGADEKNPHPPPSYS